MTHVGLHFVAHGRRCADVRDISYHSSFIVAEDHPALQGHFPGRPVVPGVVMLDEVAAALTRWRFARVVGLPQVKFLSPLLPGQRADLHLEDGINGVRFKVLHAGVLIATGQAEIVAEDLA
ncbi:MAG: hydroxymyristoyl-ACP dehydratase [Rudaea sp.]